MDDNTQFDDTTEMVLISVYSGFTRGEVHTLERGLVFLAEDDSTFRGLFRLMGQLERFLHRQLHPQIFHYVEPPADRPEVKGLFLGIAA